MLTSGYGIRCTTTFFGRRRPLTNKFSEFMESVENASTGDFLRLREAIYEQESRGRFLVQGKFGKTYVGESWGDLVLVLTENSRSAFLRDIDRTCERVKQPDSLYEMVSRRLRREP